LLKIPTITVLDVVTAGEETEDKLLSQRSKIWVLGAPKKEISKKQFNTLFKIVKQN